MQAQVSIIQSTSVEEGSNARVWTLGSRKERACSIASRRSWQKFDGAVLQFQIPVATDSHLVSANSIYDGRRKLHKLDEMTNVVSCLIQQARKSRRQVVRLPSDISETWSSASSMLMAVLADLTAFQ